MLVSESMKFFISMLSLISFAPVALAAQATPKPTSLWQLIESGGVVMYPLAALSVLALSLIFVFVFTLRRGSVVTGRYMQAADALLRKKIISRSWLFPIDIGMLLPVSWKSRFIF